MRKIFGALALLIVLTLIPQTAQGQCKGFAKKICKLELMPYIHDGNYHAAILTEGEEAELYKTFYSDQQYRIAICGSEGLPDIEFQVIDANRNVLYDNTRDEMSKIWDFTLESSQQLKIAVKVPVVNETGDDFISGCVAIMFGFKEE